MRHYLKGLLLALCLVVINLGLAFGQEVVTLEEETVELIEAEPEMQWIWAELVSVEAEKSEIRVRYFDYEGDEEKEINIALDNKTTYENIKSANELKPGDMLSIDYVASGEGKNIARNISVEKPDTSSFEPQEELNP